jgi:hypothetical protein
MRKVWAFLLVLLLSLGSLEGTLHAQEDQPGSIESEWDIYAPEFYSRGDQTFIISMGLIFPTVFFSQGNIIEHNFSPPLGGTGSLAYNYYLDSNISIGGEIGGMFNYTVAESTLFIIPIGFRVGYQFIFHRFEIPLTVTAGFAPQRYLDMGYLGFFAKAGASLYYRFNPDWSFGVNANWGWFPQWTKDPENDVDGNIADVTIAVRYHF